MNKQIKNAVLILILVLGISYSGFALTSPDLSTLQKGVVDFSDQLSKSLPFNSSLGLNWSDAYIGNLPNFGVGGSFGFTTMQLPELNKLAGYLGYNLPFNMNKMFLPGYTAEGRIGGLFLPFDVGFKFGYLPPVGLWGTDINMNYLLVGGDIRYAILKGNIVLPKISVGAGLNYMKAGVGGKAGSAQTITYDSHSLTLSQPDVNLKWDTLALDFTAQISKSLLIITPYLGLGGTYAWSSAGYSVDATVKNENGDTIQPADLQNIKDFLNSYGLDSMDVKSSGISSIIKNSAFGLRAFGGFSINLAFIKLDLTGLYNFLDSNYGATFGLRFQL